MFYSKNCLSIDYNIPMVHVFAGYSKREKCGGKIELKLNVSCPFKAGNEDVKARPKIRSAMCEAFLNIRIKNQ